MRSRVCIALDLVSSEVVIVQPFESVGHVCRVYEIHEGEIAVLEPCAGIIRNGEVLTAGAVSPIQTLKALGSYIEHSLSRSRKMSSVVPKGRSLM